MTISTPQDTTVNLGTQSPCRIRSPPYPVPLSLTADCSGYKIPSETAHYIPVAWPSIWARPFFAPVTAHGLVGPQSKPEAVRLRWGRHSTFHPATKAQPVQPAEPAARQTHWRAHALLTLSIFRGLAACSGGPGPHLPGTQAGSPTGSGPLPVGHLATTHGTGCLHDSSVAPNMVTALAGPFGLTVSFSTWRERQFSILLLCSLEFFPLYVFQELTVRRGCGEAR